MQRLREQMATHEVTIELTDEAKELLVEKGYDPAMGARPLRRAIQRHIEDPLADFVLGRELQPGSTILVARKPEAEEVVIEVIPGAPPPPEPVTVPAGRAAGLGGRRRRQRARVGASYIRGVRAAAERPPLFPPKVRPSYAGHDDFSVRKSGPAPLGHDDFRRINCELDATSRG